MTTLTPPHPTTRAARPGAMRALPLAATAFVVASLAGNSLTESLGVEGDSIAGLAEQAGSTAYRLGVALELAGLAALAAFVGWAAAACWRAAPVAAATTAVAGTLLLAVKLGSGTVLLAALREHDRLDEATAVGLVAANAVAFELFWIPFGLFLVALAAGGRASGLLGPRVSVTGRLVGGVLLIAGVVAAVVPAYAVPVPFLLGLLWLGAVGVVAAVRRPTGSAGE